MKLRMRLRIGAKIIGGYLLIIVLLAVLAGVSLNRINSIDDQVTQVVDSNYPGVKSALEANVAVMSALARVRNFYITKEHSYAQGIQNDLAEVDKWAQQLEQSMLTADGKRMAKELKDELQTFASESNETIGLIGQEDSKAALDNLQGHLQASAGKLRKQLDDLVVRKEKQIQDNGELSQSLLDSARTTLWAITILAVLIGLGAGIVLTIAITRPLRKLVDGMTTVAQGDLTHTVNVNSGDELEDAAKAFSQMSNNLKNLIGKVAETSEQVAASSEQLSSSAEEVSKATQQVSTTIDQLAKGASDQAGNAQKAGDAAQGMAASVEQVARSSEQMTADADQAAGLTNVGQQAVAKVMEQMRAIEITTQDTAQNIQTLDGRSREIGRIVEAITGIADQTNLLALNAAIEAARAGDLGRGFAVVAEEVRKLAEQSRQAAEQISDLVRNIQGDTQRAVEQMGETGQTVATGAQVAKEAESRFEQIAILVGKIVERIRQVASAAQEASAGSTQVVSAVEGIAAVTEESAAGSEEVAAAAQEQNASVEEIAASAESLATMAQELQSAVAMFRL